MERVLLTGFKAFGGFEENPTQTILEEFVCQRSDVLLSKFLLDVDFSITAQQYEEVLATTLPHLIINMGLSAEASVVQLEKVALNIGFDRYKEARHFTLQDSSPDAYISSLPVEELAGTLSGQGIPALQSNHAGIYLCNMVYYQSLAWCEKHPNGKALFIHIPMTTEFAAKHCLEKHRAYASLPKELILQAIAILINQILPFATEDMANGTSV